MRVKRGNVSRKRHKKILKLATRSIQDRSKQWELNVVMLVVKDIKKY